MGSNDCMSADSKLTYGERVRYFSRQLITADDLTQDQNYYREKQRMHNRLLHGWGIVCGLEVTLALTTQAPLNLSIGCGYALSGPGDEIYVPADISFDLAKVIAGPKPDCSSPCSPVVSGHVDATKPFYIAIKYAECPARPVRVPPVGCGCDDTACEYSRIRDSFEIRCFVDLPKSHMPSVTNDIPDLCEVLSSKVVPCPSSPGDPWIVLARITISAPGNLTTNDIDLSDRRILLSSAILQEGLRTQCA